MKRAIFFLVLPVLFACGGDPGVTPDLTVGETEVFIMPGAPVPPDLTEGLVLGKRAVTNRFNPDIATAAFDFKLFLHPEETKLPGAEREAFPLGTFIERNPSSPDKPEIHIICFEKKYAPLDKTVNTYLFHEIVQHHIPTLLGKGPNLEHDVLWERHDFYIRLAVLRALARDDK